MLAIENVGKVYGDIVALKPVSFEADAGEFVFITGKSGSGKTTLLRLILREILPSSGKIVFKGTDISTLKGSALSSYRQKIGVVFQDFKVLTEKTLRENVEIALAVIGVPSSQWQKKVDDVLKMVGLLERSELFPVQLSGGELQRVSLARALVVNPDMILADEPTGNLDWQTSEEIMNLFIEIVKAGKLVIMATHNLSLVEKCTKMKEEKLKTKVVSLEE